MANTYSQIYIHIVFTVKGRHRFIQPQYKEELQKFMTGIITKRGQKLLAISCMPDHVHIFVGMTPSISISDLTRDIKSASSKFIRENKWYQYGFEWQKGFGAFSCGRSHIPNVARYIDNQENHHKKKTFQYEYIQLLKKHKINFDERYLFEFYHFLKNPDD